MLFSMINMKLRDQYESLYDLCDSEDIDPAPLLVKLNAAGYEYDEEHNCFQYAEVLAAAGSGVSTLPEDADAYNEKPQITTLPND